MMDALSHLSPSSPSSSSPTPRIPLRRSLTSPPPSSFDTPAHQPFFRTVQQPQTASNGQSPHTSNHPSMDIQAVQAAMSRLASQHYLSDYNRMKRNLTQSGSQGLQSGAYSLEYQNHFPPALPKPLLSINKVNDNKSTSTSQWSSHRSQSHSPKPSNTITSTTTKLQSNPSTQSHSPNKEHEAAHALLRMNSPLQAKGEAPRLHRTYTEEEGENPQPLIPFPSRNHQQAILLSPVTTALAISTPALSLSSSTSSSSSSSYTNLDADGDDQMRGDSPGPATPPDHFQPEQISSSSSPIQPRIIKEQTSSTLKELESKLHQTSAVPILIHERTSERRQPPPLPSHPVSTTPAQRALSGLGISRSGNAISSSMSKSDTSDSVLSSSSSISASMSRTISSATGAGRKFDYSHPALAGVKTSITHPMNISPLIPPELLPLFGQSMLSAGGVNTCPSVVTGHSRQGVPSDDTSRSPLGKSKFINVDPIQSSRPGSPNKFKPASSSTSKENPMEKESSLELGKQAWTLGSSPFVIAPSVDLHLLTGPNAAQALFNLTLPLSQALAMSTCVSDKPECKSACSSDLVGQGTISPVKIGNLVLSSCPGKKVRLSETHLHFLGIPEICRPGQQVEAPLTLRAAITTTSTSRSPICRDLELDFRRAMEQGDIKVVVCCLDNEELGFLGAAWEEYIRVADELGLEVIRLPMAEGYAPDTPDVLDSQLSYLITKYTLRGHSALVHCRGGVGRAGLLACSWMIKLGLLGSIVQIHDNNNNSNNNNESNIHHHLNHNQSSAALNQEMKVVEKVIEIVRKRRSAKAIETPQQVHFILQYVNWLSQHARQVTARDLLGEVESA